MLLLPRCYRAKLVTPAAISTRVMVEFRTAPAAQLGCWVALVTT